MTCSIDGCVGAVFARGWCQRHYKRWRRHGDPLLGRTTVGEPGRFLQSAVEFQGSDCLIWPFGCSASGYPTITIGRRVRSVPRLVCERAHGAPPTDEHEAAHSCGRGHLACVNARHLRWATPTENQGDRVEHGTVSRGERSGTAKLTEANVHRIRDLEGIMTQREIGVLFGVNDRAINNILRGRTWAWLPRGTPQGDRP